jgi:hypothetical protein
MTHDPLCGWPFDKGCVSGQPHKEFRENTNGYHWRICDRCGYDCDCNLIDQVRQDMLAKCIAAVEAFDDVDEIHYILAALRALEEKP